MNPSTKKAIFMLGILILAGLVFPFFLKPRLISTNHFLSPAGPKESPSSPKPTLSDQKELLVDLEAYLATQPGTWGVAITPLTIPAKGGSASGGNHQPSAINTFGINLERQFPAASVMKLLVAANLINRVDQNEFSLEKEVEGNTLTELMRRMINRTDNDAWYSLNDFLGFKNLQTFGEKLGMKNLSVYENTLSPTDVNFLLVAIYQSKVASASLTRLLLSLMGSTETEDRIPAGIPENTKIYHKAGTWAETGTYADAGIIEAKNPFILTVLSENAAPQNEAIETIRALAQKVFNSLNLQPNPGDPAS